MHPVGPFICNKQRGESRIEDDSEHYKDRPLLEVIAGLRKARKILEDHNAKPMAIDEAERHAVYARGCSKHERVADLLAEARAHGSILAFKGEGENRVTAIVPFLVDGWTAHGGMQ